MPQVVIDESRCKSCGLCVDACPQGVLALSHGLNRQGYNYVRVAQVSRCLGCRLCCLTCPDGALGLQARGVLYECFGY